MAKELVGAVDEVDVHGDLDVLRVLDKPHSKKLRRSSRRDVAVTLVEANRALEIFGGVESDAATSYRPQLFLGRGQQGFRDSATVMRGTYCHPPHMPFLPRHFLARDRAHDAAILLSNQNGHLAKTCSTGLDG